jgi:hypothetical protein
MRGLRVKIGKSLVGVEGDIFLTALLTALLTAVCPNISDFPWSVSE